MVIGKKITARTKKLEGKKREKRLERKSQDNFIFFKNKIIPKRIMDGNVIYFITEIPQSMIIKGFKVITNSKNFIKKILVENHHPNVHPKSKVLCSPEFLKNSSLTQDSLWTILYLLETYNLKGCYFNPLKHVKFYKANSTRR